MIRIASDIGGTFTDVVLDQDGRLTTIKVLSTLARPEIGLLEGVEAVLKAAGVAPGDVEQQIHGTTLATNALIERRGAVTAQITTRGFRDVLEMAHENRFDQYDLSIDRAPPLAPRHLRFEIDERIAADGRVLQPLDERGLDPILDAFATEGVESVAVTLLHAYANPEHELRLGDRLAKARPDLAISLSSDVSPEIREFERFTTTCANAYVQPLMARYLTALADELRGRGFSCPLFLVTSSGDLTDLATATAYPVRLVESGPAGGAVLAAEIARARGLDEVLAFDMGGTTAKLCLIDGGRAQSTRSFEVGRVHHHMKGSGFPVRIPAIELVEIGSGGGSIARLDPLGRLLVGPQSAGSTPGPVCYGRGGSKPTITDADLVLGKIDISRFSGGIAPDEDAARAAIAVEIGRGLGLDTDLAAFAIDEIVDENMASAARIHAIESGKDIAARTMIAFGGAAPLHAARVADKVGVDRVLIPANAGVGSAVGFLAANLAFEQVRSLYMPLAEFNARRVNVALDAMAARARALVGGEGLELVEMRLAYLRYIGQGHEITIDLPIRALTDGDAGMLREAFEARYARLFGAAMPQADVEALTWSVRVERLAQRAGPALPAFAGQAEETQAVSLRSVFDPMLGARVDYVILRREALPSGFHADGPALVTEAQTTTVVPSAFSLSVLEDGSLMLSRKPAARSLP
jgi:N-methylhydantoinase A